MTYNYSSFGAGEYDLANFRGPAAGQAVPDVMVTTREGKAKRLLEFSGEFLVLEMGSITCPLFQGRRPRMARLDQEYGDVSFAVLYVREAHPGADIPAHESLQDKESCATRLVDVDGENRQVLLDDLEGTAHSAFGGYPNSVFIINRNGCVVYASDWNSTAATAQALTQLMAGKPAQTRAYFKPVPPWVALRTLRNGGKGALSDFLRSFPNLIWNNLIRRNFLLLRGKPVGVLPTTNC